VGSFVRGRERLREFATITDAERLEQLSRMACSLEDPDLKKRIADALS
jgi:hypothetical protein